MQTSNTQHAPRGATSFKRHVLSAAMVMAISASFFAPLLLAQDDPRELDETVVVGSRAKAHSANETVAPVDVIQRADLEQAGVQEIGQILQMLEPSFNFSRTTISDGTDIIRPATLRALGPDQVLVLVNGKRRHQQALVNVQQTIGRGSAGTDINAIPVSSIERIEVLRDGAAAQYGSDAIAGVINIILRRDNSGVRGQLEIGQTYEGDGEVVHGGVNTGIDFGDGGFMNFTAEYRDRGETNRAGPDELRVDPPRVTQRIGDADATDKYLWVNGGYDMSGAELYWFGGMSKREGNSSGFFRSKGDGRTVPDVYPEGFLPTLLTEVNDWSFAFGARGTLDNGWTWDASVNRGQSEFVYREDNSINVSWYYEPKPDGSIYGSSPTSAHTGTLIADQTTFNLDFTGSVDMGMAHPMYLATGFEYRSDDYQIKAGDPVSYSYGRANDRSVVISDQNGGIAAPGIQGFPGWTPATEVNDGRHNIAFYLDGETMLNDTFTVGGAVRWEDYSDFGSTTTGKLSMRWDASDAFALRGTVSSGFRAPGVQQTFFNQVSTSLNAEGVLTDTLTARQGSDVTNAFGIKPLQEETSVSTSLGMVFTPNEQFSLTVDVFQIDIDDRIIFSSNIGVEAAAGCDADLSNCPVRRILQPYGVGQVLFFTNAIDTRTRGIDIVADYNIPMGAGELDLTALLHFNDTEVKARRSPSEVLTAEQLFDDTQVTLVEEGQPGSRHVFSATYSQDAWRLNARANYFGEVSGEGFTPGKKMTWDGAWLFDISGSYAVNDNLRFTVGANNVFDTYPDKWDRTSGAPFPQLGFTYGWETLPFGINGGYYYAKMDFSF